MSNICLLGRGGGGCVGEVVNLIRKQSISAQSFSFSFSSGSFNVFTIFSRIFLNQMKYTKILR